MKVLLIIYLISIVYYFISLILLAVILAPKVKREGLTLEKMGVADTIRAYLRLILIAVVPILNIIFGSIFLFSDDIQDIVLEKMREKNI